MTPPGALRARLGAGLEAGLALAAPALMRRALRRGLRGVWALPVPPELPRGGAIVAANHHSWWDGYLGWLLRERLDLPLGVVMGAEQLGRFRFFRRLGALSEREPRAALRRLEAGGWLLLFPEGRLRPPGALGPAEGGLAFFAGRAGVPVLPLALRVVVRGHQRPEAFLSLGDPLPPGPELERRWRERLSARLAEIDAALAAADPEAPPTGFEPWLAGAASPHERHAWLGRLWAR